MKKEFFKVTSWTASSIIHESSGFGSRAEAAKFAAGLAASGKCVRADIMSYVEEVDEHLTPETPEQEMHRKVYERLEQLDAWSDREVAAFEFRRTTHGRVVQDVEGSRLLKNGIILRLGQLMVPIQGASLVDVLGQAAAIVGSDPKLDVAREP